MATRPVIEAAGLGKRYGEQRALTGFDLAVAPGTVCGLLGPNGAGKTTAVRVLATLLRPDEGRASVAGFDVVREPRQVKARIGLVGQHAAIDEVLGGRENLVMFARLHGLRPAAARQRADELLRQFELDDAGRKPASAYSGGMRRRLDLAASLIVRPPVLFLDEPTTGLDPRSRSEVWDAVRRLVHDGTSLLLTTQYLEEADRLADRITVVDRGSVIAEGSPAELKGRVGADRIEVVVAVPADLDVARAVLESATGNANTEVDADALTVSAPAGDRVATLGRTMQLLADASLAVDDVTLRRPTLDEAFLQLTSRGRTGAPGAAPHDQEVAA